MLSTTSDYYVKRPNSFGSNPPNSIEFINPLAIKAMDIYQSMMQAPYEFGGSKTPGGVVVIWTGR